ALKAVVESFGLPLFSVDKTNLGRVVHTIEHPIFAGFTLERWRSMRAIPVDMNDRTVSVMMANPLDHDTKNVLEFELGREVKIVVGSEEQILSVLASKMHSAAVFDFDSLGAGDVGGHTQSADLVKQESSI